MTPPASPHLRTVLDALFGALSLVGKPAMLIGGMAVVARGVPRLTLDVDAVVQAEGLSLSRLWDALRQAGFEPRVADAERVAIERHVLLLTHPPSAMTVDLSLGWLNFEREALARATPLDWGGVRVPVATPEDLVIFKAVGWRGIDRSDITELVVRHHAGIDFERVRRILAQFFEVLDVPERLEDFDRLVSAALKEA